LNPCYRRERAMS